MNGVVSVAQIYLAVSIAGNAYLHMLLMSSADVSACVVPLVVLKHSGCRRIVVFGGVAGGIACFANFLASRQGKDIEHVTVEAAMLD